MGFSGQDNFSSKEFTTEEAIAIMNSRKFLENFIEQNNLMNVLFSNQLNPETQEWLSEEIPTISDGYNLIQNSIDISFDQSLITIKMTFHNQKDVALLLNALVLGVNQYIRNYSIQEAQENISFLKEEIDKTSLSASIDMLYRMIEKQTQSIMLANTRQEYAFKVIDPAVYPKSPAGPNRKIIVILGTIIGFIFSTTLVFLINFIKISRKN